MQENHQPQKDDIRVLDHKKNEAIRAHIDKFARTDIWLATWTCASCIVIYALSVVSYQYVPLWIWLWIRAGAFMRMFIAHHDCGHGSMFQSAFLNKWIGIVFGGLTFTPYEFWRKGHLYHHKIHGNADKRDPGRTIFWTSAQFERFPQGKKLLLRFLREPVVFFTLAPTFQWLLLYRTPFCPGYGWTNLIKGTELLIYWKVLGPVYVFWDLVSLILPGGFFGYLLFHLQHAVNLAYRVPADSHDRDAAAILGSTYLHVPLIFKWATLGIEYHHIHHYSTAVPSYFLKQCHDSAPAGMWDQVTEVDWKGSLRGFFNVQWNEATQRYESFQEYEWILQKLFPGL
eukprot:TRINITY_DN1092_c0_g1_i2.p1 TRINITY_DN1092_c0_g1~~TRINITY_DN1092_c0_g1_i2.p1  ORF type:complete len:357 (-),score=51.51 TRINITY_DN1092_c0_g1_i2:105-1130(-)